MATTDGSSVGRWQDFGRTADFPFKAKTKPLAPSKPRNLVSATAELGKSKPRPPRPITYESVMGRGFPKTHSVSKQSQEIDSIKKDLRPNFVTKKKPLIPLKPKTLKPDTAKGENTKKSAPPLKPKPNLSVQRPTVCSIEEVKPPIKPSFLRVSKSSGSRPKLKPVVPAKKVLAADSSAGNSASQEKAHRGGNPFHHQLTSILSQGPTELRRRSTVPESKAEEASKPSVGLNHMTKTRSKGPKRRLPTRLVQ